MDDPFDLRISQLKAKIRQRLEAAGLLSYVHPFKPAARRLWRWALLARAVARTRGDQIAQILRNLELVARFLVSFLWLRGMAGRRIPKRLPGRKNPRVVMLVVSNLSIDPRVEREARALASHGFRVTILCPAWLPPSPAPQWGPEIEVRVLPGIAGAFVYQFPHLFGKELYRAALAEDAWAYHAHDLNTALMALAAAARKRVPCLCDFHEWFSENVFFDARQRAYRPNGRLRRWLFQQVEALVLESATAVVTVSQSIGTRLQRQFKPAQPVHIIRNIPPLETSNEKPRTSCTNLRATLGIPAQTRIVLYQGGVGPSRNLEPVIRAMALVEKTVLVIRGPGMEGYGPDYLRLAERSGSGGRVFCLPPVPSAEVVREAAAADFGLWTLLSNVGLNFKLALPNKVFEYLAAGIPLLAADLPEVRAIIDTYEVGLCFDPEDPASIASAIRTLAEDEPLRRLFRTNIPRALAALDADGEWQKLVQIYRDMEAPQGTIELLLGEEARPCVG